MKKEVDPFDFSVIRKLRKRDRLTLQDVSDRSGIGLAVLSKLERNKTKAELATLFRLARVFEMSVSDLLRLAEQRMAQKVSCVPRDAGPFVFREARFGNILCLEGRAPNGARMSRPELHRDEYEICWVLEGRMRLEMPNERHDLEAGDAIQFDAVWEHVYEAMDDCRFVILHLPKAKGFS